MNCVQWTTYNSRLLVQGKEIKKLFFFRNSTFKKKCQNQFGPPPPHLDNPPKKGFSSTSAIPSLGHITEFLGIESVIVWWFAENPDNWTGRRRRRRWRGLRRLQGRESGGPPKVSRFIFHDFCQGWRPRHAMSEKQAAPPRKNPSLPRPVEI